MRQFSPDEIATTVNGSVGKYRERNVDSHVSTCYAADKLATVYVQGRDVFMRLVRQAAFKCSVLQVVRYLIVWHGWHMAVSTAGELQH